MIETIEQELNEQDIGHGGVVVFVDGKKYFVADRSADELPTVGKFSPIDDPSLNDEL